MLRNARWKLRSMVGVVLSVTLTGLVSPVAYAQSSPSIIDNITPTPTTTTTEHTLSAHGDITTELQEALNKAAEDNTGVALEPNKRL